MTARPMIAAVVLVTVAASAFAQAPAVSALQTPAAATQGIPSLPVNHQYRTTLHDANGHLISRADFDAALRHGQRYVSHANTKADEITMTLLPPGVSTPDSFAPTDLKDLKFTMIMVGGRHYSVEFHGVHGRRIDQRTFAAGAAQGQRYRQVLDGNTGSAILTLLPVGAHPPGSLSTSHWLAREMSPVHAVKHVAG